MPPGSEKNPSFVSAAGAGQAFAIASKAVSSGVSAVQAESRPPVTVLGVDDVRALDQTELRVRLSSQNKRRRVFHRRGMGWRHILVVTLQDDTGGFS